MRPDVFNHNLETVARLQRAVRPSAGYARSLAVLAHAKSAGLVTKSSLMVGIGETDDELVGALADLAGVGCDIVTIGQYLRPTTHHLPVARWVEPERFVGWKAEGESLGIGHVEAGPLTRSSYHAKRAADQVGDAPEPGEWGGRHRGVDRSLMRTATPPPVEPDSYRDGGVLDVSVGGRSPRRRSS